jgi:hypothetical protein
LALAGVLLAACSTTPQEDSVASQPSPAEVVEKARMAVAGCRAGFSEVPKDGINRANCFNVADTTCTQIARFPDLVVQSIAKRTDLAKAMASGEITRSRAISEFTELNRRLVAEEFQRLKTNPSAEVQRRAVSEGAALF